MSLKWRQRPRLVALNTGTPVLEAARAIENNNIGEVRDKTSEARPGVSARRASHTQLLVD